MAHDPKLELYKLKLINKEKGKPETFRTLFRNMFDTFGKGVKANEVFTIFATDFFKKIVQGKGYCVDEKKKKGFTIAYEEAANGQPKSQITNIFAKDSIISGVLEGGKHGVKRWLGKVDDVTKKTPIQVTNIVGDRFYFLIYTPLDHSEAIVMIQGYTEAKISDVFRDHLVDYFSYTKEIHSKIELFVPQSLIDKTLENATFESIKFSTGWHTKLAFEGLEQKNYDLQVNIQIIDKSKKKGDRKNAQ